MNEQLIPLLNQTQGPSNRMVSPKMLPGRRASRTWAWLPLVWGLLVMAMPQGAQAGATIQGLQGPSFQLRARADYLSTGEGGSLLFWGLSSVTGNKRTQYPAPTLIVNQGETVTITLSNELTENTSLIFPGQESVVATGGVPGTITREAVPGGSITYSFVAKNAGTYLYQTGTHMDVQVELGLAGALIVRPTGYNPAAPTAYGDSTSAYDHEYLFFLSEIDPRMHQAAEAGKLSTFDTTQRHATYWLINGRTGPDTLQNNNVAWLPTQPYSALSRCHPGDRVLMRVIGAGYDLHPFHHHGNHGSLIARDGRLVESVRGVSGPDLAIDVFTVQSVPGGTYDELFSWTGEGLGWDVYGHRPSDPLQPSEYAPDHGKPIPVVLPDVLNLVVGAMYSGSPYLGTLGALPPGEGGMNANAGYFFMWHSHTEQELTNDNIFPGGMMTMMIIEPPGVPIP